MLSWIVMVRNDIKALTGIRGIAALYVVFYHFTFGGGLGPQPVRRFMGHGYLAVDLFFILSGFVMSLTYARDFENGFSLAAYWNFIVRRIARIYPLYIVLTLVCLVVTCVGCNDMWGGWQTELLRLGINISLLQSLHGGLSIDLPAWSISTEFIAYLLFPALCMAALGKGLARTLGIAAFCVLTLAALSMMPSDWLPPGNRAARLAWLDQCDGRTFYPVARCLADFTLGMLMWRVSATETGRRLAARPWAGDLAALLVLGALYFRNDDTLTVVLFAPLILCLAVGTSFTARFAASRAPEALGLISYSIYLVHQPVRDILETALSTMPFKHIPGGRLPITVAETMLVIGVACVTYRLVEKPGREALRTVLTKPWPPRRPAAYMSA